ncbi:hypothetical protein [Pseudorhodoplanes sp.]|uniref:hypothetical protein n=1 Tax=Pseudorhodoplanes sp. TaxID=1934341 RepID=UPI002CBB3706|nr:hypothetical protein [Pseudorhodoplanes sp.]HWV52566.1 hypothetical protein [Pseudorhodoplanes sp.]
MIPKVMTTADIEKAFDLIAEHVDSVEEGKRMLFLAKACLCLANLVGNADRVRDVLDACAQDL